MMLQLIFWIAVLMAAYAYFGYPAVLLAIGACRRRGVRREPIRPRVSVIITAYNEAAAIGRKLANTLEQDYPPERLEIIVASDHSTDGTDDLARQSSPRVVVVRSPARRGKEAAQQLAVQAASGDVLVFSDVATILDRDGVARIVENFADPTVGCVSSVDRFIDAAGRVSGEGAYVRYEMWLRLLETRVNTLVGLSGSFFAVRRSLCGRWAPDRQSDFNTLLTTVDQGMRGVLDPGSVGYYANIADERHEFDRKARTVLRSLHVFFANRRLLNPFRYGLFSWQLASHKLSRWLVPFDMIAAFAANAALAAGSGFYRATLLAQCAFYAAAVAGRATGIGAFRMPAYLCTVNLAVLTAWFRFARGERMAAWTPSARAASMAGTDAR